MRQLCTLTAILGMLGCAESEPPESRGPLTDDEYLIYHVTKDIQDIRIDEATLHETPVTWEQRLKVAAWVAERDTKLVGVNSAQHQEIFELADRRFEWDDRFVYHFESEGASVRTVGIESGGEGFWSSLTVLVDRSTGCITKVCSTEILF